MFPQPFCVCQRISEFSCHSKIRRREPGFNLPLIHYGVIPKLCHEGRRAGDRQQATRTSRTSDFPAATANEHGKLRSLQNMTIVST
jgi:hypothetical protein